jgi:DNA repair protein RecN (Recombination protein N)
VLLELRLESYAVIDHVAVEFAPGLNLLTGETGAGKSILIDALALLLGEKASVDVIRHGAERAVVSGVFEAEESARKRGQKSAAKILEENGIDSEGTSILLRREISASGKARVFVNNQPATVAVLKQLAPCLGVIHAQNDSSLAFDAATRLELLDSYCGADLQPVTDAFVKWREIRGRIAELERDEQDRLRQLDLWNFQNQEIGGARPQAGEDEQLENERRVLANAERIYSTAMAAYDAMYEGGASAASSLRSATRQLEELARFDAKFLELAASVDSARITVEDAATTVRDYAGGVQASPERLAEIEDRLALLDRLKRKYGPTLDDVIRYGEEVAGKLNQMENKEEILRQLRAELGSAAAEYVKAAAVLSKSRREAARRLQTQVEAEINDLAMKAKFKIEVAGSEDEDYWSENGSDQVTYMISTNPGEPMHPLEEIASGGELSRVMLALKASVEAGGTKRKSEIPRTIVFDEIDTGIGGRAAEAVGRKLKELARAHQVLCITHLPQIASFADHHYLIEKKDGSGRVRTTVRPISGMERAEELARMLSGAKLTEASLKHAQQMLKSNA